MNRVLRQAYIPVTFVMLSSVFGAACFLDGSWPDAVTGEPTAVPCTTACRIFVSATSTTGNFGSIAEADAICGSDANNPNDGGAFKAMVVLGTTRRACTTENCSGGGSDEHIDWVLKSSTNYYRASDGALIGTTDANGLLGATLSNWIDGDGVIDGSEVFVWTGIKYQEGHFGSDRWTNAPSHCSGWTSDSNSEAGQVGLPEQTNRCYVDCGNPVCSTPSPFYCVEQ